MGVNPLALLEGTMAAEGMGVPSLWGYNDYNEGLHQRLIDTQWELQSFQAHAREEMQKKEEHIQKLLLLLKATSQERDEAKEQLQLLLSNVKLLPMLPNAASEHCSMESDTVSDTCNHSQSYVSSPITSLFNPDASPELPNIAVAGISKYDQASASLEQLASRRPLPEKGKLMDAVIRAGPLLQSLLVAGPLPCWKNPPPLQQLQIPPVSVKARNSQTLNHLVQTNCSGLSIDTMMHGVPTKRAAMVSPCSGSLACMSVKRYRSQ